MSAEKQATFLGLLIQSGIGLMTAIGPFVLAAGGSPLDGVIGLVAVGVAAAGLVLAVLYLRGSNAAAGWLAGLQALNLLGAGLALNLHLGADGHLAALVTNLGLPVLLLVLLLRARAAAAAQRPVPIS